MKIKIEKFASNADLLQVTFSSEFGKGFAQWVGLPPTSGEIYDVEIDIDEVLTWGESVTTSTSDIPAIYLKGGLLYFVGRVVQYEKNGCLSLSIGDSVILVSVEGAPDELGTTVVCKTASVKLYPTNI